MLAVLKTLLLRMRTAGKLVLKQILPYQRSWDVEHWFSKSVVSPSRTYTTGRVGLFTSLERLKPVTCQPQL